ncbi:MAG: hypothetical protein KJZ87_23260, partial [Thermoguttaceae bacterium]|nr:hypothetical protein [Thermoguttaceae bacterium]
MNRSWTISLAGSAAACLLALLAARSLDAAEASARVLIVTGEDYPGHKWQETTPALKSQLEKDSRLAVDVLDDLKRLPSADL